MNYDDVMLKLAYDISASSYRNSMDSWSESDIKITRDNIVLLETIISDIEHGLSFEKFGPSKSENSGTGIFV